MSLNKFTQGIFSFGISMMTQQSLMYKQRKEELLERWRATSNMPRKMKKQERKEI